MPGLEASWLNLQVSEKDLRMTSKKNRALIVVPKKLVPLATRRNRLRRLIREAWRQDPFFRKEGSYFRFKVVAAPPKELGLAQLKSLVERLKASC